MPLCSSLNWGPRSLTQLPLRGTHGLHHPNGQCGLQHGHSHVGKAEGAWGDSAMSHHGCPEARTLPAHRGCRQLTCSHQDIRVFEECKERSPFGTLRTWTTKTFICIVYKSPPFSQNLRKYGRGVSTDSTGSGGQCPSAAPTSDVNHK